MWRERTFDDAQPGLAAIGGALAHGQEQSLEVTQVAAAEISKALREVTLQRAIERAQHLAQLGRDHVRFDFLPLHEAFDAWLDLDDAIAPGE